MFLRRALLLFFLAWCLPAFADLSPPNELPIVGYGWSPNNITFPSVSAAAADYVATQFSSQGWSLQSVGTFNGTSASFVMAKEPRPSDGWVETQSAAIGFHVHGQPQKCTTAYGTKSPWATYKGDLPSGSFCKDDCQFKTSGISLGLKQGTAQAEWSGEAVSEGVACPSTIPVPTVGTAPSVNDATKTCVVGESQGELCMSKQAQNCGTVNGKAICYDSLPSGKCTFIGNGNYACDKGSTAPSSIAPIPEPGAPTPVKIGTVSLPLGVGGVAGSGGLSGPVIDVYGNPTGLLPDAIPSGTPGSEATPLNVKFPTDYAKNAPVESIKENTKVSADKLVAIDKLLAGTNTDATVISDKGTTGVDDLDKAFKDRHVSIDTRLANPVGSGLDFNFAFPIASCMGLPWNVHGFQGEWNFCNEWDAVGRPALAWLFFGLTAFYLYSLFHTSGRSTG